MLSVIVLSVIMLSVIMLSVIMLSVIMLSVIMMSRTGPLQVGKQEAWGYPLRALNYKAPDLWLKKLARDNTLAYLPWESVTNKEGFITSLHGCVL